MDAREYFQLVVQPNYYEFYKAQNYIRLLWNAIVSMNTVPEFLVLHQLGYPPEVSRDMLDAMAQEIREELGLTRLQYCANTLKHVRKINRGQSSATACSILEDIVRGIETAQIVIAEITPTNENVFYEVGYAHALKKPTILLADKDKKLPFDLSGYRCLFYQNSIGGKRLVEEGLRKHLQAILDE